MALLLVCVLAACDNEKNDGSMDWVWADARRDGVLAGEGYHYAAPAKRLQRYVEFSGNGQVLCSEVGCQRGEDTCEAYIHRFSN